MCIVFPTTLNHSIRDLLSYLLYLLRQFQYVVYKTSYTVNETLQLQVWLDSTEDILNIGRVVRNA